MKPRVGSIVHVYDGPNGNPQAAIVTSIFKVTFNGSLAMDVTVFEDREHKNGRAMMTRRRLSATPDDHSPSITRWQSYWKWPDEEEA